MEQKVVESTRANVRGQIVSDGIQVSIVETKVYGPLKLPRFGGERVGVKKKESHEDTVGETVC